MKPLIASLMIAGTSLISPGADLPDNLVADGIPPIPAEIKNNASRYMEFRAAGFNNWHPVRREMLITTRFAEATQLHLVKSPGAARKQLTFLPEPVGGGSFRPKTGDFIVFTQDVGGGEFYQLFRYDPIDGKITLLTDGKSRNTGARWSYSGQSLAYTSTRRNGKDNNIYVMDPADPKTDRMVLEVTGGGWGVSDWSLDEQKLLVSEYISINESYLYVVDARTGAKELLTPKNAEKVSYSAAQFAKDGKSVFATADKDSEFRRLISIDLGTRHPTPLTAHLNWDVESFDLSPDGKILAFVTNEEGVGVLHLMESQNGKEKRAPKLPLGVIGGLNWHENGRDLGFTFSSAKSPSDAYSLNVKSGLVERWTESETGGINPTTFVEPKLIKLKSFDGLPISAFVYDPDPARFPGKRPVIVNIHGGPESQSRPIFQGRNNYFINEMGFTVIYPNVRGSSGYGKTFLTLDNGFKREDSVRDIGAILEWIKTQPTLDADRVVVVGGSYGGYMVLASMIHYADRLRAGVDVVGISNFLTFLRNTQDYRRDLRRVEYGDERDPAMSEFLHTISPTTNVQKITRPLFVIQGKNDPRVPVTESEQMVKAIRDNGRTVWYLMAKDEGHGFAKRPNQDVQFLSMILFLNQFGIAE